MPMQSNIIAGLGLLLGFQFGGEMIARVVGMPIPGSIVGLLLLLAWLNIQASFGHEPLESADATDLVQVARPLLRNLTILFVPSGVGIMEFADVFTAHGVTLTLVVIASTLLTLATTALAFVAAQSILARRRHRHRLTIQSIVSSAKRKG